MLLHTSSLLLVKSTLNETKRNCQKISKIKYIHINGSEKTSFEKNRFDKKKKKNSGKTSYKKDRFDRLKQE